MQCCSRSGCTPCASLPDVENPLWPQFQARSHAFGHETSLNPTIIFLFPSIFLYFPLLSIDFPLFPLYLSSKRPRGPITRQKPLCSSFFLGTHATSRCTEPQLRQRTAREASGTERELKPVEKSRRPSVPSGKNGLKTSFLGCFACFFA